MENLPQITPTLARVMTVHRRRRLWRVTRRLERIRETEGDPVRKRRAVRDKRVVVQRGVGRTPGVGRPERCSAVGRRGQRFGVLGVDGRDEDHRDARRRCSFFGGTRGRRSLRRHVHREVVRGDVEEGHVPVVGRACVSEMELAQVLFQPIYEVVLGRCRAQLERGGRCREIGNGVGRQDVAPIEVRENPKSGARRAHAR